MQQTTTIQYQGAELMLERPTVRTRLTEDIIAARLGLHAISDPAERYYTMAFASFAALVVSQTAAIEGDGIGFTIPALTASSEDWQRARDDWLNADAHLLRLVDAAISQLRQPPGGMGLSPEADAGEKNG